MNDTLVRPNGNSTAARESRGHVWFTPRFDVYEQASEYVLVGDLPGVAAEGLEVTFEKGELSIHGRVQPRCEQARCFAGEYGVGDYRRTFTIGDAIHGENISAELKDGVLSVHLPKRAEARARKIEVRS